MLAVASALICATVPSPSIAEDQDGALIALSARFEPLYARWLEISPALADRQHQISDTMERRSATLPARVGAGSAVESWEEGYRRAAAAAPHADLAVEFEELSEQLLAVTDEIFEETPATILGCAIKARSAYCRSHLDGFYSGAGLFAVTDALEDICRLAGMPSPRLPWPSA